MAYKLAEHSLWYHKILVIARSAPPQLQPQHRAALFLPLVSLPQTSALMVNWILCAVLLLLTFLFPTRIRLVPLAIMEKKPEKSRKSNTNGTDFSTEPFWRLTADRRILDDSRATSLQIAYSYSRKSSVNMKEGKFYEELHSTKPTWQQSRRHIL